MQSASLINLLKILNIENQALIQTENQLELVRKTSSSCSKDATFHYSADFFDETFFNMKVGKIVDVEISHQLTSNALTKLERELPYVYTTARLSITHMPLIQSLLQRKWLLLDTTVDLVCKVADIAPVAIMDSVEPAVPSDLPKLLECSRAFSHGRLFSDPLFSKGGQLYREWIQNSFDKKVANEVLVLRSKSSFIEGFASIREHVIADFKYWEIPLVTKHPDSKRPGVAKILLQAILNEAKKKKIVAVLIGTHGDNIPALRSYIGAGFKPYDTGATLRFYKAHLAKGS